MKSNWLELPLADVCSLITDGTHHSPPNSRIGEFKYVTAKNIRPWGLDLTDITFVDPDTHDGIYARCPVEYGDVLYIKDGVTTGIAAINTLTEPFSMLSSVALLKPMRDVLEPRYLKHWLNSPVAYKKMTGEMTGTAIKRLVLREIRSSLINIAPLGEQKRIVDKLDTVLARVDACRERLNRVPLILKRFRQSVLTAAVTGELTKQWRESQSVDGWQSIKLGDAAKFIDYRGRTPTKTSTGIPLITAKNIRTGFVSFEPKEFIAESNYEEWMTRGIPNKGDVLITTEAPLGNVAVIDWDFKFALAQRVICLQFSANVFGHYAAIALQSEAFRSVLLEQSTGTTVAGIKAARLKQLEIPLPSVIEQHEIVRRVEKLFLFADCLEKRLANATNVTKRLSPALLAKAFRGELVQQDPNDEPVTELLKRLASTRESATKSKLTSKSASHA